MWAINVTAKGVLGYGDHELNEYRILKKAGKVSNSVRALDFVELYLGLPRTLLGCISCDTAITESWLIFKHYSLLRSKPFLCARYCSRRFLWLSRELLN